MAPLAAHVIIFFQNEMHKASQALSAEVDVDTDQQETTPTSKTEPETTSSADLSSAVESCKRSVQLHDAICCLKL